MTKILKNELVSHIRNLLIQLNHGFAFVGQKYPIKTGQKYLYIDLLFYHVKLRYYIIIKLKSSKSDSHDAGQMSAYISAVDNQLKSKDDQPSIGIILCPCALTSKRIKSQFTHN